MTEQEITQQLASRTTPEPVVDVTYPAPPTDAPNVDSNFADTLLPEEKMTQQQLLDYLGVPMAQRHDPIIENYMNSVYTWARDNAKSGDMTQLLRVISEQEQHLGSVLKPDRLRRLAEYVKIAGIRQQL